MTSNITLVLFYCSVLLHISLHKCEYQCMDDKLILIVSGSGTYIIFLYELFKTVDSRTYTSFYNNEVNVFSYSPSLSKANISNSLL